MNPMSIMAQAEKLGIPELQRSIQNGVVPAFIGVPLLQEKVKKAKQMQMGMAAQQPKRPSVAEQVGQEAQQATIADIMKAQALKMQGEMGQTGGISDSLPKPEGYAKGGPIAFAEGTYGEDIRTQLQRLLAEQEAAQYGEFGNTGWTPEEVSQYRSPWERQKAYEAGLAKRDAFVGPRKGAAFSSPEAQAYLRDPSFIGRGTPIDEFVGPSVDLNKPSTLGEVDPWTGGVRGESRALEKTKAALGKAGSALGRVGEAVSLPLNVYAAGKEYGVDPKLLMAAAGNEKAKQSVASGETRLPGAVEGVLTHGIASGPAFDAYRYLKGKMAPIDPSQPAPNVKDLVAQARAKPFGESNLPMLEGYGNSLMPVAIDRRAPVAQAAAENILNKNASNRQAPDADQAQAMQDRIVTRKAPPVMGGNAPAVTQTPYAQAAAPATQTQPAQEEEKDLTLAERMKEYRDATGENKGIDALRGRLSEREARLAKEESRAPWMALMQAGLSTMAGTSPNALSNIGQGGAAGLQAYTRSMNKLEDAKDKSLDIQAKLEEAQRGEQLAAAKYGLDSVQADKKARATAKLEQKKMDHDFKIHELDNAARLQIENIQAGATRYSADARANMYGGAGAGKPVKLTDQQRYYNNVVAAMEADPNYMPELRLPNGQPDPVKLEILRKKTYANQRDEALFGGMGMGGGMGSGMMPTQPAAANTGKSPGYALLSSQ